MNYMQFFSGDYVALAKIHMFKTKLVQYQFEKVSDQF